MERTLCGLTAYRYYQIPPQILVLYPPLPEPYLDPKHQKIGNSPLAVDLLETPLHRLVDSTRNCSATKLYVSHTVARDLPFGSIRKTEHGFDVASPEFALLGMAATLNKYNLLLAAYELCGSHSTFEPCKRAEQLLAEAIQRGDLSKDDGWKRTKSTTGEATSLWKRDPLTTPEKLERFSKQAQGLRGIKKLRWAAANVTGVCASPLEAKASMLLGLSRTSGGLGMRFANNHRINLSGTAQALYRHGHCYADLYLDANDAHGPIAIECQGASVHSGEAAGLNDARRTTALALMGVQVIPLTHDQLAKPNGWAAVKQLLAQVVGVDISKSALQRGAENELRHALFPNEEEDE